ncbi:hypothetical protein DVH24_036291, partial [Malus domestica]
RVWKRDILELLFCEEEINLIRSILISICDPSNRLIWHYKVKGCFLVKFAYHVTCEWLTPVNRKLCTHVCRQANTVAHRLARFGLNVGSQCEWFAQPHSFIIDLLIEDTM